MKSFTTDPLDLMCFGMGSAFDAKSVQSFLNLKLDEVYRISEGIPTAVRLEDAMTEGDKATVPVRVGCRSPGRPFS
jgi:hypothetical protein